MWLMVKSLQRLIFWKGGSTTIVLVRNKTVIYQRDKFVQCYEASSSCYMYLASKVARCNISSNTKETNMHAIASQWLTDHIKYVLPPFQNKCLNFVQTLVQSCSTTKVDTYFGTEAAKEKKAMQSLALEPWTLTRLQFAGNVRAS
jgi:16S rRNA G966 N2-methylase RsmD